MSDSTIASTNPGVAGTESGGTNAKYVEKSFNP
jgi:hypothetical protein